MVIMNAEDQGYSSITESTPTQQLDRGMANLPVLCRGCGLLGLREFCVSYVGFVWLEWVCISFVQFL